MGHEVWPSYHRQIAWLKDYLRKRADITNCVNNMKQLTLALYMWSSDHNDAFPSADNWRKDLYDYVGADIFNCPKSGKPYQYIRQTTALKNIKQSNRVIVFYEDFGHHDGMVAVAFADGHVQTYSPDGCKTIEEFAEHHKLLLKAEVK